MIDREDIPVIKNILNIHTMKTLTILHYYIMY
jgi:hypothetical protein